MLVVQAPGQLKELCFTKYGSAFAVSLEGDSRRARGNYSFLNFLDSGISVCPGERLGKMGASTTL